MLGHSSDLFLSQSDAYDIEAEASPEQVVEAVVILVICVAIVVTNVLIIWAVSSSPSPKDAIDLYVLSVAVADLLCGVCIVPLSIYPAFVKEWVMTPLSVVLGFEIVRRLEALGRGPNCKRPHENCTNLTFTVYGNLICRLTGYLGLTLWSVCLYTFMWMSVDRYLAIRKPLRYDVIQTRTRCQCWMVFTWLTSLFLCSPPLLGFSKGRFYGDGHICMLDLGNMIPYSITLAVLVLAPSILTICYTYYFILSTMYKLRKCLSREEREYATAVSENLSNPDHLMSFVLIILFWINWTPWFGFRIYEQISKTKEEYHALHFWLLWLGITNCIWKFFVYLTMSPKFRFNLKRLCLSTCCRAPTRQPLVV
ncbi:g-protein coupled receptor 52 [Caerostris darwini]|uniref:G-protein coupled receptor 52 n=1 Tax=Caerostris darwini TaxID=1538125 RepID=A0AAV4T7R4_9ARAC|nr:g-protein coupled receptor 52 [Caerostris darwini]